MRTIARVLILTLSVGLASIAGARGMPQTSPSGGVIRVAVRSSGTLEPISGALVTLTPGTASGAATTPSFSRGGQSGPSAGPTITTGAEGVAVFDRLAYGSYTIRVDRDGYFATNPAVTTATTSAIAGPQPADVSVLLTQGSSISGRVLDAYGVPIASARVLAGNIGYRDGRRVYLQQSSTQPDGFGNYVLTPLGNGEYYIRLESAAARGSGDFYPGVTDADAAIRIPVQTGQQIVGIDFNLSNAPTFKVSGTVLNLPARTLANGQPDSTVPNLTFASADPHNADSQPSPLLPNGRRGSNGEFELTLPPGLWDVFPVINLRAPARGAAANGAPAPGVPIYATGRVRVFVADRDVENVTVTIAASDIKGHIVIEGAATSTPKSMGVTLLPLDNTPSPLISNVRVAQSPDAAGDFSYSSVPPGRYSLRFTRIPPGFYVADIRVGSRSIYDDGVFDIGTEPIGAVEVTLRSGGGKVQVTSARPAAPAAFAGSGSRFVLIPTGAHSQNFLLFKNAVARIPSWTFSDLAPGEYKVFAFEALPAGGAEQNAEFMAKYESLGVPVHVNPGETVSVDVSWIPAEQ